MKSALTLAAAALISAGAHAQDDQNYTGFTGVEAGGQFDLVITVGGDFSVVADGDPEDIAEIKIDRRGDDLELEQKSGLFGRTKDLDVTYRITMPSFDDGDFSRGLSARVSGVAGGDVDLDVSTGALVEVSGRCDRVDVDVSTGGELDAEALECRDANVDASTGGGADVFASESVDADATLGGYVEVHGGPGRFSIDESLGGEVRVRGGEG